MQVSRDEAREVAVVALLLVAGLRVLSGVVQLIEEFDREHTWESLAGRFLAPVGSTLGLFVFGAAMIVALSPSGSVSRRVMRAARDGSGFVGLLGVASSLLSLTTGFSTTGRIWFALINGFAATVLGFTGWWLLRNLDPNR
ncbi:MAG: hypothetical protein HKN94_05580 [Acidimicrobiales bacterium]|nr:hypothetical protein [Acidimicrobiales bacterium]RZV47949.1 MAG: hypothetical protein EX269_03740 [Acidimicrobiales bacterium]